ncbi:exported hypothetical protein [Frankia sp. Hr75.2]|nr:exported hypothetical protein [Frankia sp. Hr75.2]
MRSSSSSILMAMSRPIPLTHAPNRTVNPKITTFTAGERPASIKPTTTQTPPSAARRPIPRHLHINDLRTTTLSFRAVHTGTASGFILDIKENGAKRMGIIVRYGDHYVN